MVFSSPWFFAFLALTLVVLSAPIANETKKRLVAVASCLFYAAWDYRYVALLLAISTIDFACARRIAMSARRRQRTVWLCVSLVTNLGLLSYFKYANFFLCVVDALGARLGAAPIQPLDILLPAGISFYTFKTMSYVIDVYRAEIEPVDSVLDYVMFVTFFPELIAGPIVRASVFLPQMVRKIGATRERLAIGCSAFLLGFTKKVIADRLGLFVAPVFAQPSHFGRATLWAAVLGYSVQIYCDFAGYSDMAIGTAKMIGYDLPENFNMPYLSHDVAEFWRRWHITLSSWLRDYLYIPLGGNRRGPVRTYVNLTLTMLLGGLWHGASWTFVLWGALHGLALALHRAYRSALPDHVALPNWLAIPGTALFVSLCWIPFRCTTFSAMRAFCRGLVAGGSSPWSAPVDLAVLVAIVLVGHAFGLAIARGRLAGRTSMLDRLGLRVTHNAISGPYAVLSFDTLRGAYLTLAWATLAFLLFERVNAPFLYFQF